MELSIKEAKTRFSEVASAAARGERVVVTKNGQPFIEMVPAKLRGGMDFERAREVSRKLGLDRAGLEVPDHFNDPAYSRQVLGLEP